MIESREQRKKSSLFRRRVIIICVASVILLAAAITLLVVYNFVNTVIYYTDPADGTKYKIVNENDKWVMYDLDGNPLKKEERFQYYVTKKGTFVEVRDDGTYYTRAVPDVDTADGEFTEYEKVLIFNHLSQKQVRSIEIHNADDTYTFWRYNIEKKQIDDSCDFVYRGSPQLAIRKDAMAALISDAGYPLATKRIENPVKLADGSIDFSEYGLVPEKRTRTVKDDEGNETVEEYDYTPAYYIVTDTSGKQYKMLIGNRLINGGGYYAQYIKMENGTQTPRNKVYILAASISETLLAEAKNFITPGIAYPTTSADYYKVTDFEIKKLNTSDEYEKIVGFTFDSSNRTDTVKSNKPYYFNDDRSKSYHPDFDKIDVCLLDIMDPEIVDIAELHPSNETLADEKYGLMKKITDENGNTKYVFASKYVVSCERETEISITSTTSSGTQESKKEKVRYLQTIYISDKNENGNHYSYTTITILDGSKVSSIGIDLDLICEVSSTTYNFLTYTKNDWTYPAFMETAIRFATKLELTRLDYSTSFGINYYTEQGNNAISIKASDTKDRAVTTFGMINAKDADNKHRWYVSRNDVHLYNASGERLSGGDMATGENDLGEKTTYLKKPFKTADGRIVYVNLNDIVVRYPNGQTVKYVRYQTFIFQKLYQSVNSLRLAGDYELENEAEFIAKPENLYATFALTNSEGNTIEAKFYSVTSRKLYVVVNGEGGYYVSTSAVDKVFENVEKFYNNIDIEIQR